jgi:hypothetical protein
MVNVRPESDPYCAGPRFIFCLALSHSDHSKVLCALQYHCNEWNGETRSRESREVDQLQEGPVPECIEFSQCANGKRNIEKTARYVTVESSATAFDEKAFILDLHTAEGDRGDLIREVARRRRRLRRQPSFLSKTALPLIAKPAFPSHW